MLKQEYIVNGQLDHPNIIKFFDFQQDCDLKLDIGVAHCCAILMEAATCDMIDVLNEYGNKMPLATLAKYFN